MTCLRTQGFLAKTKVTIGETVNAKNRKLTRQDALALLRDADELYAMKGKKVTYLNLKKDRPAAKELLALVLGPTGNLRAPTLKRGRTLIVGFDEPTYARLFG
jgi:arsenate reductase-like glutaredoxin family protein